MLKHISIKNLYPLALAEGEGVGTAYEYYAKRLQLASWLSKRESPRHILITGLPEKYGASMDFVLLAAELGASLTIVDDRPMAVERCKSAVAALEDGGHLTAIRPEYLLTRHLPTMPELSKKFDLAFSSETLQRLSHADRVSYLATVRNLAGQVALFAPNGDNPAHTSHSGLSGLQLSELILLTTQVSVPARAPIAGYIDMPPFPPGITRSEDQREQASTGTIEAIAMWGLTYFARMERWIPKGVRRSKSHIVFTFFDTFQR